MAYLTRKNLTCAPVTFDNVEVSYTAYLNRRKSFIHLRACFCECHHVLLSVIYSIIFIFYLLSHFSMKFLCANRIAPDGTPRFAASHLGLFCLPMSPKRDARLKRVKKN